jgi:hypothetical protein
MKRIAITIFMSMLTVPVWAQQPPETVIIPSVTISEMVNILKEMPYEKVAHVMSDLQACFSIQVPDKHGTIVDQGQCPAVTAALHHDAPPIPKPSIHNQPDQGKSTSP